MEHLSNALRETFITMVVEPLAILVVIGFIALLVFIFGGLGGANKGDPPYYGS